MNELRKDYLLNRWVIIAKNRRMRPTDFLHESVEEKSGVCYFCPGNEDMTPPELDRISEGEKWIIRCFPNKFPATTLECGEVKTGPETDLFTKISAYGKHEVITETPRHGEYFHELSVEHLVSVFDLYSSRIKEMRKDERIKYVTVFKNQGKEAGASIDHSHTQLIALSIVPPLVNAEAKASNRYLKEKGSCPFCDIWRCEKKSGRLIFEDEYTISFTPFASRFPFEVWIMPKRHVRSLSELKYEEKQSFADMLKRILSRLYTGLNNPPYNFWFHQSPDDCNLHFHLELAPRLAKFAGLELGSEIVINTVSPEFAARHYQEG